MKKILAAIAVFILGTALLIGGWLLLSDAPMKTLESLAIRHADKLPLAYLGEKVFDKNCASCHDHPETHAPSREALSGFSKETILIALEFGKMQPMAAHLSKQERGLAAIYLAGSAPVDDWIEDHRCQAPASADSTEYVSNWGLGSHNQRFVPEAIAGINRDNVGSLELAWALAFPKVTDMRSQPAIIGDTLYFGDKTGKLYAIDRKTGCIRANTEVLSGIRSAITVATLNNGKNLLVFADSMASIFAVDPDTLDIVWQEAARIYETSVITGSISYHDDRLFIPVSSYEVAVSGSPTHVCCKSHGGVIALDARNGIYEIPMLLHEQGLDDIVLERLGIEARPTDLSEWREVVDRMTNTRFEVTVAMVGKYVNHADAYKSLTEALQHGGLRQRIKVNILRLESEEIEKNGVGCLENVDAILVPGGFGERGFEGKVLAIQYARENKVPYLGICFGMQAAVVEFARNVCSLEDANSTEINPQTSAPVIGLITEWLDASGSVETRSEDSDLGGTMRLGGQRCRLRPGSLARNLYGKDIITERHRHRYEFNNHYRDILQKNGMLLSGHSMDETLVEIVEIPGHPWFLGCQFHPEFTSTPRDGHPLFTGFIEAALKSQQGELPAEVASL